jgi:hypothetical protein
MAISNFPGGAPDGLFGSLLLEGGLALDVGAPLVDENSAKGLHALAQQAMPEIQKQAGPFGKHVQKLQFKQTDPDLVLQAKLTDAEVSEVVGAIEKEMGGLGSLL